MVLRWNAVGSRSVEVDPEDLAPRICVVADELLTWLARIVRST